jgi:hypothetical protein
MLALCGPLLAAVAGAAVPSRSQTSHLSAVQVAYLTSCGGCHGVEGVSAPLVVPTLRHLTGSFLCTRQGREFIVRLPDVALSSLSDRMLTRVMNWVVFDLGAPKDGWIRPGSNGRPALPDARRFTPPPYTVAEISRLRRQPLTQTGLTAHREEVVAHIQARCAAPAGLSVYGAAYGTTVVSPSPRS